MNLATIEMRWKQAQESYQAAARYPAHAIADMAWCIKEIKELQQENQALLETTRELLEIAKNP